LAFLDIEIKVNGNGFDTWIWRKPTNSGILLNFKAMCPLNWKSGLIVCLLKRSITVCSGDSLLRCEIANLRNMFLKNGYPGRFFDDVLSKFNANLKKSSTTDLDDTNEPSE